MLELKDGVLKCSCGRTWRLVDEEVPKEPEPVPIRDSETAASLKWHENWEVSNHAIALNEALASFVSAHGRKPTRREVIEAVRDLFASGRAPGGFSQAALIPALDAAVSIGRVVEDFSEAAPA